MSVLAVQVLFLCLRTLYFVGNASKLICKLRRSKILDTFDPSWLKYDLNEYSSARRELFCKIFKLTLTDQIEEDIAFDITKKESILVNQVDPLSLPGGISIIHVILSFFQGAVLLCMGASRARTYTIHVLPNTPLDINPKEDVHFPIHKDISRSSARGLSSTAYFVDSRIALHQIRS